MYAQEIHSLDDIERILTDESLVKSLREGLLEGNVYIVRNFMPKDKILRIREYLQGIGRSSLPNYQAVEEACPNFHRIDRWDPRAHVKACLHTFSFFPWNQDVFGFFDLFKPVYNLKNRLSGLPADHFLNNKPDLGCVARLSFQYYPRGIGGLNLHQDPFDYHQITVPAMMMSKKGEDFHQGGSYVETKNGKAFIDDICDYGDIAYFNAQCNHGVERIDPDADPDWLSQNGRWIALFAVNKLKDNSKVGDSKDLGPNCADNDSDDSGLGELK